MEEIWRDVSDYEGLYQVSNLGRVKSFRKWKRARCPDEYILNSSVNNSGYHVVTLYNGKSKRKFLVHRLVAQAFVENPFSFQNVNHKDEDKNNNTAYNLEWCTVQYNNCYGTAKFRAMLTVGTPVEQRLSSGELLATYRTSTIAEKITGISKKEIMACVRGKLHSAGGFIWKSVQPPSVFSN